MNEAAARSAEETPAAVGASAETSVVPHQPTERDASLNYFMARLALFEGSYCRVL